MTLNETTIGYGNSGDVRRYGNHAPYLAEKSIRLYSERVRQCTKRELTALERLSHPNIVKFYGQNQKTLDGCEYLMIYMELCERYSLRHVLKDATVIYNLKTVFGWAEHLASALLCLKQNQILHRDIKPENVFVTNSFILKLGDFGLGKDLTTGSMMTCGVGTNQYKSPEAFGYFRKTETNYKSDLYGMGLVLWEMVERREVFSPELESQGIYAIFNDIKNNRYALQFTDCDDELAELVSECVRLHYDERPDIEDFLKETVRLNSSYNEESFQPMIEINQQTIQKPKCRRKSNTNNKDLLQNELVDELNIKETVCDETTIDHGSSGDVRQYGNHAPYVAVKSIKIYSNDIKKYAERELKALEKLSHSNIVKFYQHEQKNRNDCDHLMIYMEFCERLSLRHVLDDPAVVYNLKTVFAWAEHLASALACLKENQILHRDIKPENVFVTNRFTLKLGGFDLAKHLETGSSMSLVGTKRYMSPETSDYFGKPETNYKSDLYGMGLVLWEMVERRKVFSPEYESQGIYAILVDLENGRYALQFTDCDDELKNLILQCIRFDHNSRPDIEDFSNETARLNSNYNEATFQPLIQINQRTIQKPHCIRKAKTNERHLKLDLVDMKIKEINWRFGYVRGLNVDNPKDLFVKLNDDGLEKSSSFTEKSTNDAILFLKSLAIRQGHSKLLEMFEKRIQNFSKFPDDYVFCNYEYPKFPPMIDQELLDYLAEQKYGEHFVQNIKSALERCELGWRNDFKAWLSETLDALRWYDRAKPEPARFLLQAIEHIHSIIDRILDNPFYQQWLVLSCDKTTRHVGETKILLSKKRIDPQIKRSLSFHQGFHIESCLKDLLEILENLMKDMNINPELFKDYLRRYQPRKCVFPFRAYRFEWGKSVGVDKCEEIKMSDIDPEILADYESLRQAYECALKILVTHSKGEENPFNENDQIKQIETCLFELEKSRKCPNYFYFHARELRDDESQNGNILCIDPSETKKFRNFLGDDLIWRWMRSQEDFLPPSVIIRVDELIDLLYELLLFLRRRIL